MNAPGNGGARDQPAWRRRCERPRKVTFSDYWRCHGPPKRFQRTALSYSGLPMLCQRCQRLRGHGKLSALVATKCPLRRPTHSGGAKPPLGSQSISWRTRGRQAIRYASPQRVSNACPPGLRLAAARRNIAGVADRCVSHADDGPLARMPAAVRVLKTIVLVLLLVNDDMRADLGCT